ncbi:DUF808 domain-containing protein [Pasteurellaceae bacterium LIM206]|nr:DUF808 domain-containing protein [Pasteurellaceae bacterium LIM206]
MAFSSLFTLLDDIASVLDDVALMTKTAAKKTVGVLSDDLALNADQVSGKDVRAERELPIVWAVAKGSLINKAVLVPLALLLSVYFPPLITVLLIIGGSYLCFEGMEKLLHHIVFKLHDETDKNKTAASERDKIKGAIRTDFILSAEIIIIALGALEQAEPLTKILSLCAVGVGITLFVYGLVALIVKLDDIGLWLMQRPNILAQKSGQFLIFIMPWFMKALSFIGTIAMFLVGGGIFVHYLPVVHHFIEGLHINENLMFMANFAVGIIVGVIACAIILPIMKVFGKNT